MTIITISYSCEHEIEKKCRLDDFSYEKYDQEISALDYSIYNLLLSHYPSGDYIYLDQGTISRSFPFDMIQGDSLEPEELMYNNYSIYSNSTIANPTSYLNPIEFEEYDNLCVIPIGEYGYFNVSESIVLTSFTRIGFNSDSTEAIVAFRNTNGTFYKYLKLVDEEWEILWSGGLTDQ